MMVVLFVVSCYHLHCKTFIIHNLHTSNLSIKLLHQISCWDS